MRNRPLTLVCLCGLYALGAIFGIRQGRGASASSASSTTIDLLYDQDIQELERGEVEIDAVFVTDCSDYQEWMTHVFLTQWLRTGPGRGTRLTRIVACDDEDPMLPRVLSHAAQFADEVELFRLPELNGKGKDRYLCNNRPRGLRRWLQARPPRSKDHWVVLLDPDMLMLRPLDAQGSWRLAGGALAGTPAARLADVPEGVALAHHFAFLPQVWEKLNREGNLSLAGLCSDRGATLPLCRERLTGLWDDPGLVAAEFSVGVPHMIRAMDMVRLANAWEVFTDQVRSTYRGWTAEMFSWLLAARYAGLRFAYLGEVVTDPDTPEPAWERVSIDARSDDVCKGGDVAPVGPAVGELAASSVLRGSVADQDPEWPLLVHFCEVYNLTWSEDEGRRKKFFLDKRAVKKILKSLSKMDGGHNVSLLDCDGPLFTTPPRDVADRRPEAMPVERYRRNSWMMCSTLNALNTGLRDFRRRHCPGGGAQGPEAETLEAAPMAHQVASLLFKAKAQKKQADWLEQFNATRNRRHRGREDRI